MTPLLATLTPEQYAAVRSDCVRTYVSAPPGAGKTMVIAGRVAHLIEEGVDAEDILVLVFTRSACAEIRERVASQVGPVADRVLIETFHGAALLLGPQVGKLDVASEAEERAARESLYVGPKRRPARETRACTRWLLGSAIGRYEARGGGDVGTGAGLIRHARERLEKAGLVPTWHLVPRLLREGAERDFLHVLVDEAQDVTPAERRMADRLLSQIDACLYAVGDPRQAIMGWRGAEPGAFGEPTHELTRTFRFGSRIAREASALEVGASITGVSDHDDDVVPISWDDDPAAFLAAYPGGTAILTRTHADAAAVEKILGDDRVRHVQRDPRDPLSEVADRIADTLAAGLVPVSTVHSFKGREADQVVVIGPSTIAWGRAKPEDPEELRVLFVAMTRARRRLVLVSGMPPANVAWRCRWDGIAGGRLA